MRLSPYTRDFLTAWAYIVAGLIVVALICYELGTRAADITYEQTKVHIRY